MAKKTMDCNEDLVVDLLNFSRFGPMGQVFIMEAIQHYAKQVLDGESVGSPAPEQLWRDIAVDVKTRCDKFYGRHEGDKVAQDGEAAPA